MRAKALCRYCLSTVTACDDVEAETCQNLETIKAPARFKSIPVCELREGQTLVMTQETIAIPPVRGHSVAKDKMEIVLRKGSDLRLVVWNRNRLVKIEL